jgi:hypothetical protein
MARANFVIFKRSSDVLPEQLRIIEVDLPCLRLPPPTRQT